MNKKNGNRGLKIALVILLILLGLLLALLGGVYGYYHSKIAKLQADKTWSEEDMLLSAEQEAELAQQSQQFASEMDALLAGLEEAEPVQAQGEVRRDDGVINILFIGTDERTTEFSTNARGDSCILFSVNTNGATPVVSLVSFERGMGMPILSGPYAGQWDWLTHLFRYGGAEMMMASLEDCFKLEIDYYVRVNFNTFITGIDALGGVDVEFDSTEAQYFIDAYDYPAAVGTNHLNGEMALKYVRLRAIDSDWQRIQRQREVIMAALTQLKSMHLTEANATIDTCLGLVRTNLPESVITELVLLLPSLPNATMQQMTIPQQGTYGSKTVMGDRGCFAADFQTNTEILHKFIYGNYIRTED